jgi:hypothetical protein
MKKLEINIEEFTEEQAKRAATTEILDRIVKVMFFWLEEEQEGLDEPEAMDEFSDFLWTVAVSAISSVNINIFGKDENGKYLATIEPCASSREYLISEDVGEEDHIFWEDYLTDIAPDSGFGRHDDKIMSKIGY